MPSSAYANFTREARKAVEMGCSTGAISLGVWTRLASYMLVATACAVCSSIR